MSLVVAQMTSDGPRIVSDMRVRPPFDQRPSLRLNVLKSIVIAPELAISFAGDVGLGLDCVRKCAEMHGARETLDNIVEVAGAFASKMDDAVEFIVATTLDDHKLIRIGRGGIERDLGATWIGDQAAFESFQSNRHRLDGALSDFMAINWPESVRIGHSLGTAMEAVIADAKVASVDDFCIQVSAKDGALNYLGGSFIHVGRDIAVRSGDNLILKMAQPVSEGGYSVTIVPPRLPGIAALGLSFPMARLGYLYLPLKFDEAKVLQDVPAQNFAAVTFEEFGVELQDPMLR